MNNRIISDPNICGGEYCIKGIRMPVSVILSHLAAGESYEEVLKNFPNVIIDDIYSMVGSFNLDFLSSTKLLEIHVGILSNDVALKLKSQFFEDLENSNEIKLESLKKRNIFRRTLQKICFGLSKIMELFLATDETKI